MSTKLLAYLAATFVMTLLIGIGAGGSSDWSLGLLLWAVTGFLAFLLYGEQKGHPAVLLLPFLMLLVFLSLKISAAN
jgi:hypothetical protein